MPVELNFFYNPGQLQIELVVHSQRLFRLMLLLITSTLCRAVTGDFEADLSLSEINPDNWEESNNEVFHRKLLKQGSQGETTEQTQTESLVALIVIVSVALLFLFKICICMIRVSRAEREAEVAASGSSQLRGRRLPPPPLPVLFVNPGGSVRIGKKLKRYNDDCVSPLHEEQPCETNQLYLFGEAEIIDTSSHNSNSPSSESMRQALLEDTSK
eukprot:g8308.t1